MKMREIYEILDLLDTDLWDAHGYIDNDINDMTISDIQDAFYEANCNLTGLCEQIKEYKDMIRAKAAVDCAERF